jgi:hypothetical protein
MATSSQKNKRVLLVRDGNWLGGAIVETIGDFFGPSSRTARDRDGFGLKKEPNALKGSAGVG